MALPSAPNSISLNQVATYVGLSSGSNITLNTGIVRTIANILTGAISLNDLRGGVLNYIDITYPGTVANATQGDNRRLTFTSSSSITVNYAPADGEQELNYLIVGGGGGGGGGISGGGGAGGMRTGTMIMSQGTYPITVGAGGSGGTGGPNSGAGSSGSPSSFNGITSAGGGRGGRFSAGNSGGSGGGGSVRGSPVSGWPGGAGNTPSTTPPQGNPGGTGSYTIPGNGSGGGGGGAGSSGSNSPGPYPTADGHIYRGGPGGNGSQWPLEVSLLGPNQPTYAGGGGGGCSQPGGAHGPAQIGAGSGGPGGGGNGSVGAANATNGTANLGSGGGGAGQRDTPQYRGAGGNGGSGNVRLVYKYQ